MLKQLWKHSETTPDLWERAVFKSLTGHSREDIDWDFEDNQAGFYTWIKAFDGLIDELIDDGYVKIEEKSGRRLLIATDVAPPIEFSYQTYPTR